MPPTTRYAKHGDRSIAYQVFGQGDVDIVYTTARNSSACPGKPLSLRVP